MDKKENAIEHICADGISRPINFTYKEDYNVVNNTLIAIANNAIEVLEMAKLAYKHADAEMFNHIGSASALEAAKAEAAKTTADNK